MEVTGSNPVGCAISPFQSKTENQWPLLTQPALPGRSEWRPAQILARRIEDASATFKSSGGACLVGGVDDLLKLQAGRPAARHAEGVVAGRAGGQDHSPHARHGQKRRPQPPTDRPGRTDRRSARAFADIEAQRTGTQLIVDLPEHVPRIVVDRIMIEQVLLNLIKNGIEAMGDIPVDRRQLTLQARLLDERTL